MSLFAWSANPLVASWPSPLPWSPAAAGMTAIPVGNSKLYLRRACAPCLGLAPSGMAVYLCRVPTLSVSDSVPRCGRGSGAVLGLPTLASSPPPAPRASVARVLGGFLSPSHPGLSSPGTPSPSVVTTEVSSPRGNSATQWVSMPCGDSTPPPTPWRYPLGFPPLHRPCGPPPRPPFPRTREPLQRPRDPPNCRPLPRTRQTDFPPACNCPP